MSVKSNTVNIRRSFLVLSFVLIAVVISACGQQTDQPGENGVRLAPLASMPAEVQKAAVNVQVAYQFALANPDTLKEIPCYCGCGPMGHSSNYNCYIKESESGKTSFDNHALGCGICVDITLDTMRMVEEGKPLGEIREVIDQTYSRYGPTNMP